MNIPFKATWGDTELSCAEGDLRLSDLRFYLSAVELIDATGNSHALELHTDIPWQQSDLALVDLENGQAACNGGNSATYAYLVGGVPPGNYTGLRFTLGVPFDRNHANPLTAAAPLDDPAMHWHWRSGYKFLRAGAATRDDGFWIHLGSAGCEGTVRNISGCRFPNRVVVELDGFVPNEDTVSIDLMALFDGIDFTDGVAGDCSSGPSESACAAPFSALGLNFATGDLSGQQRVFSVHR